MKKLCILSLIFIVNIVNAANGNSGYISLTDKPMQIISDGDNSRVFVYGAQINDSGCPAETPTPVLLIGPNQLVGKELYSTLLTAKATGKKVMLITKECWLNGNPIIFSIYLDQ